MLTAEADGVFIEVRPKQMLTIAEANVESVDPGMLDAIRAEALREGAASDVQPPTVRATATRPEQGYPVRRSQAHHHVRRAHSEDAAAIAAVHVASWRAAYRGLLPDDYLASLSVEELVHRWTGILDAPAAGHVVVADTGAGPVGFAQVGPAGDAEAPPATGELVTLYLHPDVWGCGLGKDLLRAAVDRLSHDGYRRARLWMLSTNDRARRFYLGQGWSQVDGERTQTFGGQVVTDHRFARPLAAATPAPEEPE